MSIPVLYSFRRCPYAIRARMTLVHCGVVSELREVELKNKPQTMLDLSSKGTVPVLQLDGLVIDESLDVMRWALNKLALDAEPQEGWQAALLKHPLVIKNDGYFKHWLDRYKYFDRHPESPQIDYLNNALVFLEQLEAAMVEGEPGTWFIDMPKSSCLDIAIFPFVRQFAFVDKAEFDALPLPKLHAWLDYWLSDSLFLSVMSKHPAWSEQQIEPVLFG